MERIASFCVDHLKLQRGIYLSRRDVVGNEVITSFDIRMKAPYREPVLGGAEIHTMEHLAATWLRNSDWKDKIIYWGPMGCMTGNYLILAGDYTSKDIANKDNQADEEGRLLQDVLGKESPQVIQEFHKDSLDLIFRSNGAQVTDILRLQQFANQGFIIQHGGER